MTIQMYSYGTIISHFEEQWKETQSPTGILQLMQESFIILAACKRRLSICELNIIER